ncbi:MAG: hypothetical protein ACSHW6_14505 [Sulfitobacter geojensis]
MTKRSSVEASRRTSRNLRRILFDLFTPMDVMAVEQGIRNRNLGHSKDHQRQLWSTVRVRNEVDIALTLLQRRYEDNKGKTLSRSDLISIAVMEAMPALVAKTAA